MSYFSKVPLSLLNESPPELSTPSSLALSPTQSPQQHSLSSPLPSLLSAALPYPNLSPPSSPNPVESNRIQRARLHLRNAPRPKFSAPNSSPGRKVTLERMQRSGGFYVPREREFGKPVLAVRGKARDTGLAWFGKKVYESEGPGIEEKSEERTPGITVPKFRGLDGKLNGVKRKLDVGKDASRSVKPKRISSNELEQNDVVHLKKPSKKFFVKATCRYGWENSTRCVFVSYNCDLNRFKRKLAEAFTLRTGFDVCYKDEDGDIVRVTSETEMSPFLELVRKQNGRVRVRMIAPHGVITK